MCQNRDCVAPVAVASAVDNIDPAVRKDHRRVTRLHDPDWLGEVAQTAFHDRPCKTADRVCAMSLPRGTAGNQDRALLEDVAKGLRITRQEGVLQKDLELLGGSRS